MGTRQGICLLLVTLAAAGSACSTPEDLGGQGSSCLMFTDCQPAYVCIANVCTNDLDALMAFEPVGSDAAANDSATIAEANLPESYVPQSEGAPPAEAGTPVPDATQPPAEAAPMPGPDGSPGPDSSSPGPDSTTLDVAAQPPEAASSD